MSPEEIVEHPHMKLLLSLIAEQHERARSVTDPKAGGEAMRAIWYLEHLEPEVLSAFATLNADKWAKHLKRIVAVLQGVDVPDEIQGLVVKQALEALVLESMWFGYCLRDRREDLG